MKKRVELWGINIEICDDVYEPHDDTELLVSAILENETNITGKKVLEIGAGTGLISIILAKKGADVTAVDINEKAVECTKRNARINNINIEVLEGDLFEPVSGKKYDIIVFNPPYLPEESLDRYLSLTYREAVIGGEKGNEVIIKFLKELPNYLSENGKAYFVTSSLSDVKEIMIVAIENRLRLELVKKARYFFEVLFVYKASLVC